MRIQKNRKPSPPLALSACAGDWWRVAVALLGMLLLQQLWTSSLTTGSVSGHRPSEKNSTENTIENTIDNTTETLVVPNEGTIAPTSVPTPLPLYSNLSCPFEWGKYSCFHQGRLQQAQSSYEHASLHLSNRSRTPGASPSPPRQRLPNNVLLVGDSTMRQVFVALGCGLLPVLSDYFVDWADGWPCHGSPNCVRGGEHSGFNVGWMALPPNTRVWFVPHAGSLRHKQPGILAGFRNELASNHSVSFRLTPGHERVFLGTDDVVVYNAGLHQNDRTGLYQQLDGLGRELLSLRSQQHHSLPRWVYLTTVTQHFATSDGQYAGKGQSKRCQPSVPSNPRLESELDHLREGVNVDRIVEVDDLDAGTLHVGAYDGTDCTHYCMPGVPDVTAQRLLELLHSLTTGEAASS